MNPYDEKHDQSQLTHEEKWIRELLRQAIPPIGNDAEPAHDLWPDMLKRLDGKAAPVPWFDWALLAGMIGVAAFVPASIPVILYYL
jgi:hypothetical protein